MQNCLVGKASKVKNLAQVRGEELKISAMLERSRVRSE
jgi:hypothetical protein